MSSPVKNKLSIYLIKSEYQDAEVIVDDIDNLEKLEISEGLTLYYGDSHTYRPGWVGKFFRDSVPDEAAIFNASSKALLMVEVDIAGKKRIFCISFGQGRHIMQSGAWEESFGLKVTLNAIDPNNLRSIEKTNMSSVPKHASEQISRDGAAADFGIDIEQDLVRAVTGKSKEELFGLTITGKDSLQSSVKIDISNVKEFLIACFNKSQSDDYKKDFGWIDQISEIKDPHLVDELNGELVNRIRAIELEKTWIAVPQIIEWEDVAGFKYRNSIRDQNEDDISLPAFLESLTATAREDVSLELLKSRKVYCFSASTDQLLHRWPIYNCIYSEISISGKTYLLNNGKWYQINDDFAAKVNSDFEVLRDAGSTLSFPDCGNEREDVYNQRVAAENGMRCLDSDNVIYGGGYSRIEFCDLLTRDKQIVHVKKYGGSSVLSHLFSQAVVSGEAFLSAEEFREKLNEKLEGAYKLDDPSTKPDPADYEIIFGVISKSTAALELPFFSKVTLRNAKIRLEAFGFKRISLAKIQHIEGEADIE
ncbi:MAG: TIGR04141 family sporadically distributed protein [Actinobacteria bacterium]|nr:TIGR04141 family sporadically distributed protein [Actinomycetota bacterium]